MEKIKAKKIWMDDYTYNMVCCILRKRVVEVRKEKRDDYADNILQTLGDWEEIPWQNIPDGE